MQKLTPDDGEWYLRDLNSSNGTFVNKQLLDRRIKLTGGDQIQCGDTVLLFASGQASAVDYGIALLDDDAHTVSIEEAVEATDEKVILDPALEAHLAKEQLQVLFARHILDRSSKFKKRASGEHRRCDL